MIAQFIILVETVYQWEIMMVMGTMKEMKETKVMKEVVTKLS
jgi:hypothetical protein